MSKLFFKAFLFAGFISISSSALGATPPLSPTLNETPTRETQASEDELERARAVNITTPPAPNFDLATPSYIYRFRNSISFRTGAAITVSDLNNPGPVSGFAYWLPIENKKLELLGLEVGTDLERNSTGSIHAVLRHMTGQEDVRFFYKWGLGLSIVASDQFVTLLRLKNWQARGGIGVEITLTDPMSLRWDLEAHAASEKTRLLTTLGLSFAW